MAALSFIAMIAGMGALGYSAFAVLGLSLRALQSLFRMHFKQATQYLALLAFAALSLSLCSYLFNSQPVEWPFAPAHIPLYIACLLVSHLVLQVLPRKWMGEPVSEIAESKEQKSKRNLVEAEKRVLSTLRAFKVGAEINESCPACQQRISLVLLPSGAQTIIKVGCQCGICNGRYSLKPDAG